MFDSNLEKAIIARATSKQMRDKLRKCDFGEDATPDMQLQLGGVMDGVQNKQKEPKEQSVYCNDDEKDRQKLRQLLARLLDEGAPEQE